MEKLAVINLNPNNATITIVSYSMSGSFIVDRQITEPLSLIQDIDRDGYLKPTRIEECIRLLKIFRDIIDKENINNIVSLASFAFSNVRNQLAFFDEIYKTVSLLFKLLNLEDTMQSVHQAVLYSMATTKGVLIDVQEHYVHIIKYNRRMIIESAQLPFGAAKLADTFLDVTDPISKMSKMTELVMSEINKLTFTHEFDGEFDVIGMGLAFLNAGKLVRKSKHYPLDMAHNFVINNSNFMPVYNLIKALDLDKTKKLKGISNTRADILASGLAIIKAIFSTVASGDIKICGFGQTHGDTVRALLSQSQERSLNDVLGYSLSTINEFYPTASNIQDMYNVAIVLYKQLKVLHKLSKNYVKALRIAACMCTSGKRISYIDYEANCFHAIVNANIMGAEHKDIVLAGFIAGSQNLDDFNTVNWIRYKDIVSEDDLDAVKKLSVLIKLASSLCCTGIHNVVDITCDVLGDTVILKTEVGHNAALEISQAMNCADDFKKVYGKNLQIL